jgi:hypothetical protein
MEVLYLLYVLAAGTENLRATCQNGKHSNNLTSNFEPEYSDCASVN